MPSVAAQCKTLDLCSSKAALILRETSVVNYSILKQQPDCMRLLPSNSKALAAAADGTETESIDTSELLPVSMSSTANPVHSQVHPIDEIAEPIEICSRATQRLIPEPNDIGDGFLDEHRQRSSSFNTGILRNHHQTNLPHVTVDPLRRFSETQSMTKTGTGSAENVAAHPGYHQHHHLRHSNTAPEFPPLALSNDSGYQTPPTCRQQQCQPGHNTSPPWPPNRHNQWPSHVSPPAGHCVFQSGQDATPAVSQPLPPLSIETGHYQPEPGTPQLIVAQPPSFYQSMNPMGYNPPGGVNYQQQRSHEQYGSMQSQGSATPEEGVCGYQRDRKQRLVNTLHTEESELARLKAEEQQLREFILREKESNVEIDNSATEREVVSLTTENQMLAMQIQELIQNVPNPLPVTPVLRQAQSPIYRVVPVGLPPVTPVPAPRVSSPSRPIVQQPQTHNPHYGATATDPTGATGLAPPPAYPHMAAGAIMYPGTQPGRTPPKTAPPRPPQPPGQPDQAVEESEMWSCSKCTLLNHPLISICEACDAPRPRAGNV